jgi:hypothetical protein
MEIGNFWTALAKYKVRIGVITALFFLGIGFSEPAYCSISSSSACSPQYNEVSVQKNSSNQLPKNKCLQPPATSQKWNEPPKAMLPNELPKLFTDPPKPTPIIPDNLSEEIINKPGK